MFPNKKHRDIDILLVFMSPVLYPTVFPYGAEIIRNELQSRGFAVSIILPFLFPDPIAYSQEILSNTKAKIIGFSFRNLDEAGFGFNEDGEFNFIDELVSLVRLAKKFGHHTVLGGSGFSIAPYQLIEATKAEIGFVGTSEKQFAEYCDRILNQHMSPNTAAQELSAAVKLGSTLKATPPCNQLGLPSEYNGAIKELLGLNGSTVGVRTKSGCSLRCSYCVVPSIEALILRPWSDIKRELKQAIDAGLGERVFIADGEFNLPTADYAINLCNLISQEFGNNIKWRCYIDAGNVTSALVSAMERAGCSDISITADSYSNNGRLGLAKGSTVHEAINATELFIDSGIETTINLLFGGPNESLISVQTTAEQAKRFHLLGAHLAITIGLRVYPHTPLAKMVTSHSYSRYYQPCKSYPWLGVFCSPIERSKLADSIMQILPKSKRISYTNTITLEEKYFYRRLAHGAAMLYDKEYILAKQHFLNLFGDFPMRKEAALGLLNAEVGDRAIRA